MRPMPYVYDKLTDSKQFKKISDQRVHFVRCADTIICDGLLYYYTWQTFTQNIENMTKEIESSEDPHLYTLVTHIGAGTP